MATRLASSAGASSSAASISLDHAVVALVLVERADDPVAPAPDLAVAVHHVGHGAAAVPVAVPPDVHPVPAPALAVLGAGQQPVDDLLVGVRRRVGEEGVQLLAGRRQADQVEVDAAQQGVRLRRGRTQRHALRWCARGQERVDRIAAAGPILRR